MVHISKAAHSAQMCFLACHFILWLKAPQWKSLFQKQKFVECSET